MLGIGWTILTPLLTAAVFTFVFSGVFQMRWSGRSGSPYDFALMLLVGMMVHGLFAEAINRAPSLVVQNASYVTKVVFPLGILPLVVVLAALVNAGIATVIVLAGNLLINGVVHWTVLLFPLVIAPYLIFVTALVMVFAACGVFIRDLTQIVSLLVTVSLFMTPIFYPLDAVPPRFQVLMRLNPLTPVVEGSRNVLVLGTVPDFGNLAIYAACALASLAAAFWIFRRLRGAFADVL
jgi:lipopolysaccharide transport system permease protein